ncbi:hypothetical protein [Nitrosomonas sp. Nm51]|uniref:hypothetical protein n=1 Tax=Nitrosomonas sp. Nm51 TaxID=133720 RepID=UPI001C430D19|nr:hypothetical protein [Nitrosomonas sp. Nm51]
MPAARLPLAEPVHSCTADGFCSHTLGTMERESAGLSAASGNTNIMQPFYLTDAMVNLTQLEHAAAGLHWFDARPLSALITNSYFLETCFFPPVYWCLCPSDPSKKISKECNDLWLKAVKTFKDKGHLTATEYTELLKKCPEFMKLFYKDTKNESDTVYPVFKLKTTVLANLDAFEEWKKKADEEAKKKQKKIEDAEKKEQEAYDKSHGGKGHSPCECWELVGYAAYTNGNRIPITSKFSDKPTKIPKENVCLVSGQGKEVKGMHEFKSISGRPNCCTFEYLSKYVQVAHSLPKGGNIKPKYTGIEHGKYKSYNQYAEYEYWLTLTSTPNHYGWEYMNIINNFKVGKKRQAEVTESIESNQLNKGLGKIEMNIDGVNCPAKTLWYLAE